MYIFTLNGLNHSIPTSSEMIGNNELLLKSITSLSKCQSTEAKDFILKRKDNSRTEHLVITYSKHSYGLYHFVIHES